MSNDSDEWYNRYAIQLFIMWGIGALGAFVFGWRTLAIILTAPLAVAFFLALAREGYEKKK